MTNQSENDNGVLVQIASYNTNLQGVLGLPQDLVDWLSPTLQVSKFLSGGARAPDIFAVGFQELLPLHLGLAGLSKAVLDNRNALILSQIEVNAPNKESYSLIAKIANVGIALLVYARDDGAARRVTDVQTSWTGSGIGYMGNKGAVGIRFRIADDTQAGVGETFTFVNCHLTPFDHKVRQRLEDYKHIVSSLLFPPSSPNIQTSSTLYDTSHLFVFGDLNFRLELPASHPLSEAVKTSQFSEAISSENVRRELKEYDQLTREQNKGNIFVGLHEGDFWKFKCSYKYKVGEVDKYSMRRTPSWTDRILYATHTDTPGQSSTVRNLLYTSIPSYTASDHKPIVSLLLLPSPSAIPSPKIPKISLPPSYQPTADPQANMKRYAGRVLDRLIGVIWWLLTLLGAGSGIFGLLNFVVGLGAFTWWKGRPLNAVSTNNVV